LKPVGIRAAAPSCGTLQAGQGAPTPPPLQACEPPMAGRDDPR
jgi:hypothetical protein